MERLNVSDMLRDRLKAQGNVTVQLWIFLNDVLVQNIKNTAHNKFRCVFLTLDCEGKDKFLEKANKTLTKSLFGNIDNIQ